MVEWIIIACPSAPGITKPASMDTRSIFKRTRRRLVNRKSIVLVLSFVSLILLYSYSYPSLNYSGTPFLFEDDFFIRMSLYTYVTSMLGFYIKKYKCRNRQDPT